MEQYIGWGIYETKTGKKHHIILGWYDESKQGFLCSYIDGKGDNFYLGFDWIRGALRGQNPSWYMKPEHKPTEQDFAELL